MGDQHKQHSPFFFPDFFLTSAVFGFPFAPWLRGKGPKLEAQISSRAENGRVDVSCSSVDVDDLQKSNGKSLQNSQSSSDGMRQSLQAALKFYVLQNSFIEQYAERSRSFRLETWKDDPQVLIRVCSRTHGLNCTGWHG